MQRTDRVQVRDPRAGAVLPSCWTLKTPEHQIAAAEAALSAMSATPGLLRFNIFRGIEDLTLFLLSQWTDEAARDAYMMVSGKPRAATDDAVPNISRDWRDPASLHRSFISRDGLSGGRAAASQTSGPSGSTRVGRHRHCRARIGYRADAGLVRGELVLAGSRRILDLLYQIQVVVLATITRKA